MQGFRRFEGSRANGGDNEGIGHLKVSFLESWSQAPLDQLKTGSHVLAWAQASTSNLQLKELTKATDNQEHVFGQLGFIAEQRNTKNEGDGDKW